MVKEECLRGDGLFHKGHDIQSINETTFKCWWCKKYFKEVDVNGNLISQQKQDSVEIK